MPCTPFNLPGGTFGFICSRTRNRTFVCACGRPATLQCDAPTKRRSGTCDKPLCAACATETGPDQHLCPTHAAERATLAAKPAEQLDLFA